MVFSAKPLWVSMKPLSQYSHCSIVTVWYGTINNQGYGELTISSGQIPQSLFPHKISNSDHHSSVIVLKNYKIKMF